MHTQAIIRHSRQPPPDPLKRLPSYAQAEKPSIPDCQATSKAHVRSYHSDRQRDTSILAKQRTKQESRMDLSISSRSKLTCRTRRQRRAESNTKDNQEKRNQETRNNPRARKSSPRTRNQCTSKCNSRQSATHPTNELGKPQPIIPYHRKVKPLFLLSAWCRSPKIALILGRSPYKRVRASASISFWPPSRQIWSWWCLDNWLWYWRQVLDARKTVVCVENVTAHLPTLASCPTRP